jgi:hypothetical protein
MLKRQIALLAALVFLPLFAQAEVKAEMKVEKITVQNGKEVRGSADKAAPGDILQLTAIYMNTDKSAAKQVFATVNIDPYEEYILGTASPNGAMASTDGTNFAPLPLKRKVKNSEGKMVDQEVPASEYRALRWSLGDLQGNQSRTVSARVKLRTTK